MAAIFVACVKQSIVHFLYEAILFSFILDFAWKVRQIEGFSCKLDDNLTDLTNFFANIFFKERWARPKALVALAQRLVESGSDFSCCPAVPKRANGEY